jgi:putative hydrolase of the HAD superfamily
MSQVRAVFFDAVGTLIHPDPVAPKVYADAARRFGSRYTEENIAKRFSGAFRRQEEIDRAAGWITSARRERERWQAIVRDVLDDVTDPEGCFEYLYAHFARPGSWRCLPETAPVLEGLRARDLFLGIASNFDERLFGIVRELPLLRLLADNVVVSSEVGFRKPATQFFQALCRQANLPADSILHVGDDPDNDYAGAREAGLAAVLFDPRDKNRSVFRRVRELAEVTAILVA